MPLSFPSGMQAANSLSEIAALGAAAQRAALQNIGLANGLGGLTFTAWGTNENIVLTPNGTGRAVVVGASSNTAPGATNKGILQAYTETNVGLSGGGYTAPPYGFWLQAQERRVGTAGTYPLVLQPAGGSILIGKTTDSSTGILQLADGTTAAAGLGLGSDVSLYRNGANGQATLAGLVAVLSVRSTSGGQPAALNFVPNGANGHIQFNGTTAMLIDSGFNATFTEWVIAKTRVSVVTASGNVSAAAARTMEVNTGAGARVDRTLPTAAAGLEYEFICDNANGLRVIANTGDIIRIAGNVGTAAGYTESTTVGSVLRLKAIDATYWFCTNGPVGTWSAPT